jgi:uncharacterized protein with GYD domain
MASYIMLNTLTDQGVRNIRDTANRAESAREMAKLYGVTVKDLFWTLGQYDTVGIYEAADEAAMTAFALAINQAGNVRTQLMRAYNKDEMKNVLAKMAKAKEAVPA